MDACFVCHDDDPGRLLYRVCRCETCLHSECFERLMREVPAHSTACPVCRVAYAKEVQRWHACVWAETHVLARIGFILALCAVEAGLLVYIVCVHARVPEWSGRILLFVGVVSAVASLLALGYVLHLHFRVFHTVCCFRSVQLVHNTVQLPPPVARGAGSEEGDEALQV